MSFPKAADRATSDQGLSRTISTRCWSTWLIAATSRLARRILAARMFIVRMLPIATVITLMLVTRREPRIFFARDEILSQRLIP